MIPLKLIDNAAEVGGKIGTKLDTKTLALVKGGGIAKYFTKKTDNVKDAEKTAKKAKAVEKAAKEAEDAKEAAKDAERLKKAAAAEKAGDVGKGVGKGVGKVDDVGKGVGKGAGNIDDVADIGKQTKKATGLVEDMDKANDTLKKNSKIIDFLKKNPKKTVFAGAVALLGAAGLAYSIKSFEEANNKKLGIIKMEPINSSSNNSSLNNSSTNMSSVVLITYNPQMKIVNGDKIEFGDNNMEPSHIGEQFEVLEIVSDTTFTVIISDIIKYATSGTIILKTTMENRMLDTLDKSVDKVGDVAKTGIDNIKDTVFNGISDVLSPLKPYYDYIIKGGFACCALILIIIIIKLIFMFKNIFFSK